MTQTFIATMIHSDHVDVARAALVLELQMRLDFPTGCGCKPAPPHDCYILLFFFFCGSHLSKSLVIKQMPRSLSVNAVFVCQESAKIT